jgi:hypothetical protein
MIDVLKQAIAGAPAEVEEERILPIRHAARRPIDRAKR